MDIERRILVIIGTDFAATGGLTAVVMNYYRAMNRQGLKIDVASTNNISEEDTAYKDLLDGGARYFCLGDKKKTPVKYIVNLYRVLIEGQYNVVHVNGNSATMGIELGIAKLCGVKKRIAHCHTTRSNYPKLNNFLFPLFKKTYTDAIAVSCDAGKWLFGENFLVLNNAIDLCKYAFDPATRAALRAEYNLENKFVVGNVGKLNGPKNHKFLIDIFCELRKLKNDCALVIAGGGALESELRAKCELLNIQDSVTFLGMRDDIQNILQIFDMFVFTSIFEGLGMAVIEAQASGLRCLCSDCVPRETQVTSNVWYLSLKDEPRHWAEKILDLADYDREAADIVCKQIRKSGYDITIEAKRLEDIYRY